MNVTDQIYSQSGYWELQSHKILPATIDCLQLQVESIFIDRGKYYFYYTNSLNKLSLGKHKIVARPVDKYVACRDSIKSILEILQFVTMEIIRNSSKGVSQVQVRDIEAYDKMVTDPEVQSILFTRPGM